MQGKINTMLRETKKTIQKLMKCRPTYQYYVQKYKGDMLWARSYKHSDYTVKYVKSFMSLDVVSTSIFNNDKIRDI